MLLKKVAALALSSLVLFGCADEEPAKEPVVADTPTSMTTASVDGNYQTPVIYFAFDDYSLNADAENDLSNFANYLASNSSAQVKVEGHCDERGTIEYNLALGEKRAQAIKDYLVNLGVEDARVTTISFGEENPAAEGHDEEAWSRNRRAQFTLYAN